MEESIPGWENSISREPGGRQVRAPAGANWLQEQLACWERQEGEGPSRALTERVPVGSLPILGSWGRCSGAERVPGSRVQGSTPRHGGHQAGGGKELEGECEERKPGLPVPPEWGL